MRLIAAEGAPGLRLSAMGDVGLIGRARIHHPARVLAPLAAALSDADLAFANLEFPVGRREWVREGRADEFFHDESVCPALRAAGVGLVSLANNHMMDCGAEGLRATLAACEAAGLATVGAGLDLEHARRPWRGLVAGQRVVVLAYASTAGDAARDNAPGVAPLDPEQVAEDLKRWRPEADVLVVSAHWGSMYIDHPPPRVVDLAERMAGAGADIVLGHHPHVLQPAGRIGRTLVLYSMGDAAFNCRAGDFHAEVAADKRLESAVFVIECASEQHGLSAEVHRLDEDGVPGPVDGPGRVAQESRLAELVSRFDRVREGFADEGASTLLRYEVQSLATYLRQGRWGRILRLLGSVRPRHLPVLWNAMRHRGGRA